MTEEITKWGRRWGGERGGGGRTAGEQRDFINISVVESKTVFNCQDSINRALRQAGGGWANLAAVTPSLPLDADQEFIFHRPLPSWAIWAIRIDG